MTINPGRVPRRRRPLGRLFFLLLAGLAAAAGVLLVGGGSAGAAARACPSVNRPNMLRIVAGSPQTAQLEKPFQTNLQVELANSNGCPLTGPLGGIWVDFSAPASGASGNFATSGTNQVTVGTDASGVATAPTFTANDIAGSYSVQADSDFGSVLFYLTNTASGVAASISASGQADQAASVNGRYDQPLQAQVLDANGRPVQGVSVTFSLGTGSTGASAAFLDGGAQATATTKADGQATSPPLVANGTPGRFTATASTSGIASVATYTLVNHAAATSITATSHAEQTATVATRYRQPLKARVLDENGQPIEGASVTFSLATGPTGAGASFPDGSAQATATTKPNGQATSPPFVANTMPGRFTATATVPGGTSPARYVLRNLAGTLTATRTVLSAAVNQRYRERLRARVLGERGQPVDGVTVTFTISKAASGASATFPDGTGQATATTNEAGWATSPALEANSTAGSFTAFVTSAGTGKAVRYRLRNRAGKPDSITAGAASGESTAVGSRFPIRLAVTVVDADDNPVVGAIVTFRAPARGPSGRFAIQPLRGPRTAHSSRVVRVRTNSDGIAVAPLLAANTTPGGWVVTVSVAGSRLHTAFALVNNPAGSP